MAERKLQNFKWHGRIFRYVPLVLWICIILFASTTQASMSNTSRFIRPVLEFLFPNTSEETLMIYHAYIRKSAHFTEYAILAFFASRAFWGSAIELLQKYWYLLALFVVLFIASIDEINQSFNTTRTGSIYDVILDTFGGFIMVLLLFCFRFYWKTKREKKVES
jgi:VanZ family protein